MCDLQINKLVIRDHYGLSMKELYFYLIFYSKNNAYSIKY